MGERLIFRDVTHLKIAPQSALKSLIIGLLHSRFLIMVKTDRHEYGTNIQDCSTTMQNTSMSRIPSRLKGAHPLSKMRIEY